MAAQVIPPRYTIADDDKRGLLVVNTGIALSFVWTCFLVLLWQRVRLREWKPDDWALATATVLQTAQSSIVIHLVNLGLGASQQGLPIEQLQRIVKGAFAAQILYIFTLLASKCAILCLYLRLSPRGFPGTASWTLIVLSCVWAGIAVILISVPCNTLQSVSRSQTCTNQWPKWQAIGALDVVTEVFIFSIAVSILYDLHIRFTAKLLATLAFAARLPVIIAAGIRLYFLHQKLFGNSFTSEYVVAAQWQMAYAIMASTITGVGPFLRPFTTEYTMSYKASQYGLSSGQSHRHNGSSAGPSLRRRHSATSQKYLMQQMHSSRSSNANTNISDIEQPTNIIHEPMPVLIAHPPQARIDWVVPDDQFDSIERYRRHDVEAFGGCGGGGGENAIGVALTKNPSQSPSQLTRSESRMAIGKTTEIKIGVDPNGAALRIA